MAKKIKGLFLILELILYFLRQLLIANLQVAKQVLSSNRSLTPAVFRYSFAVESDLAVTILANLITLTPGTLTLEVSLDKRELLIHTIHTSDPERVKTRIRQGFERRLQEIFRC